VLFFLFSWYRETTPDLECEEKKKGKRATTQCGR
jgi:hypothetical protein